MALTSCGQPHLLYSHKGIAPYQHTFKNRKEPALPLQHKQKCRRTLPSFGGVRRHSTYSIRGRRIAYSGGEATPSGSALRVPEAKRGRVPCVGAEEVCSEPPRSHTGAEILRRKLRGLLPSQPAHPRDRTRKKSSRHPAQQNEPGSGTPRHAEPSSSRTTTQDPGE